MADPIRQKEIDERVGRFADKFWGAFQMTENGKVKSTLLLYSFCLSWVLLAVYGGCFALFNPWLDGALQGPSTARPAARRSPGIREPGSRRTPTSTCWTRALPMR